MAVRAKVLEFEASLAEDGSFASLGHPLRPQEGWTSEALVLAGLLRCSLASLRYAAGRAGATVVSASGKARGTVTRREVDGRYAFTEVEAELEATLDPHPDAAGLAELLERAERGCFVGASLTAKPTYRWTVR